MYSCIQDLCVFFSKRRFDVDLVLLQKRVVTQQYELLRILVFFVYYYFLFIFRMFCFVCTISKFFSVFVFNANSFGCGRIKVIFFSIEPVLNKEKSNRILSFICFHSTSWCVSSPRVIILCDTISWKLKNYFKSNKNSKRIEYFSSNEIISEVYLMLHKVPRVLLVISYLKSLNQFWIKW